MKLALHYHVTLVNQAGKLYLPAYFGVFIQALAQEVGELTLLLHEANGHEVQEANYQLTALNIKWINLGKRTAAWERSLNHHKHLTHLHQQLNAFDAVIVRGPTPLAPYFKKYVAKQKLVYMVVGDYLEGAKQFKIKSIRDWVITWYLKHNDYLFRKAFKNSFVLVNSPDLLTTYKTLTPNIHLIKTTTLTQQDFYYRKNTCETNEVNILYTGRIDRAKGLFELVEAMAKLQSGAINYRLHIVGWELNAENLVTQELKNRIDQLGISTKVIFHGKKKVGVELNAFYRMADIYAIPSYFEGFPRTIWEAMANCVPVIATRVGGIPHYLTHNQHAILINPKQTNEIVEAIQNLVKDAALREQLIHHGYQLAQENTLEVQTKKMTQLIKAHLDHENKQ